MAYEYEGVTIHWYGHDTFLLEADGKGVWVDPYELPGEVPGGDLILITHDHPDHLSEEEIRKVASDSAEVVAPFVIAFPGLQAEEIDEGETREIQGVMVTAVPAYNTDKFKAPGEPFHPQEEPGVGYVVELGGVRIYHTGDTDQIPEMAGVECDVMLVPVSGTYVMTAQEAVRAVEAVGPKLAIPMHYGSIVGSEEDAKYLKEHAGVPVEILTPEGR